MYIKHEANLGKKIYPLARPCFTGMGWSVAKLFILTSQIRYLLNLIVNSPPTCIGNKIICTNNLLHVTKNIF